MCICVSVYAYVHIWVLKSENGCQIPWRWRVIGSFLVFLGEQEAFSVWLESPSPLLFCFWNRVFWNQGYPGSSYVVKTGWSSCLSSHVLGWQAVANTDSSYHYLWIKSCGNHFRVRLWEFCLSVYIPKLSFVQVNSDTTLHFLQSMHVHILTNGKFSVFFFF